MIRWISIFSLCLLAACQEFPKFPASEAGKAQNDLLAQAEGYKKSGNLTAAEALYHQLANDPATVIQADLGLASIYRQQNRPENAVAAMLHAEERAPGDTEVLANLGYALIDADKPEAAVNVFDKLTAIEPHNAGAYNAKAVAFDHAGNHVAAQEIYQKALSLSPDSMAIRNNLAMSYILNDQLDEAVTLLEVLSKEKDASPTIQQNLALAYGLKGDKKRAMEINMQSMSKEQAEENLRFYEQYAQERKKRLAEGESAPVPVLTPSTTQAPAQVPAPAQAAPAPSNTLAPAATASAPAAAETATPPAAKPGISKLFPFLNDDVSLSFPSPK